MHLGLQTIAGGLLAILATGALANNSAEPCAQITALLANATSPIVPVRLAYDCAMSMPFDKDAATTWTKEYIKYVQFQSDLELLERPPSTYLGSKVDILGGLQSILTHISQGYYSSQYQFDSDIFNLISLANDGHLGIEPCSLLAFGFASPLGAVASFSDDGVSLPKIYVGNDSILLAQGNGAGVSPVSYINGIGIDTFLESQSKYHEYQDPDARYNDMLFNLMVNPQQSQPSTGFNAELVWNGIDAYNLTFANGTTTSYPVDGLMILDSFTFTDGAELYNSLCNNTQQDSTAASASQTASQTAATSSSTASYGVAPPPFYPTPIMREAYNTIIGYYPTDEGIEDVAVLFVPTFSTEDYGDNTTFDFATTAEWFVQNASKIDGKKKIIIDIQGNGGGEILSAFGLFSVFFPNETMYSNNRLRAHDAIDLIGTIYNTGKNVQNEDVIESGLVISTMAAPNQTTPYTSWEDFYGPHNVDGVPVSSEFAVYNWADAELRLSDLYPINIDGTGGPLNAQTPPFAPEDILILSDGRCSSSCTIFVDHMISKGVNTVAIGGRPRAGPMQTLGGVKNGEVYQLSDIDTTATLAAQLLNESIAHGNPILSKEKITRFFEVNPIPLENFPFPTTGSINFVNTYTAEDTQISAQFTYQAANCHLFYTPQTLTKPSVAWALAANATWGSGKCVDGIQANTGLGAYDLGSNATINSTTHKALGLMLALGAGMS